MHQGQHARAWDKYDAYLFDIDGTLLHCRDAVHYFAFCEVLSLCVGRPMNLDGVTTHGNTDIGIVRDALLLSGEPEEQWREKLAEMRVQLCRYVEQHSNDMSIDLLPAVREVLHHLHARRAVLGVATGNLEGIGRVKLGRCGLLEFFDFSGYSDAFEYRRDVFRGALEKARKMKGLSASVCVVGDTPEDVRSARANGLDVIAVATGIHSFEQLQAEAPDWCVHTLTELFQTSSRSICNLK